MSFPVSDLTEILTARQAPEFGVVVGFIGQQVKVATQRGLVLAIPSGRLATGDRVRLLDGAAYSAPVAGGAVFCV